jgi:glutathione S-transferase
MTRNTAAAVLITMPHSHYCEKARWALDRLSLPYREKPHVPLLHRVATTQSGGRSVPVLVHGTERLIDSTDILLHADSVCGGDRLFPRDPALRIAVEALEARFDQDLGPHARRWAYSELLSERRLLRRAMSRGVSPLEAGLLPVIMPGVLRLIRSALKITPQSANRSLGVVRAVFEDVGRLLDDGRPYLVGERFTAADLTFASLAAPVLFPGEYRGAYPALDEVPLAMRIEVLRLRDTDAGRYALRLFSEERDRSSRSADQSSSEDDR